jgi:hypothetical protein
MPSLENLDTHRKALILDVAQLRTQLDKTCGSHIPCCSVRSHRSGSNCKSLFHLAPYSMRSPTKLGRA